MQVLIPRPGFGLPCPPVPTVVLPLLACSRPPFLRRSGRRSCCTGGDPDGDATVVAKKSPAAFLAFWSPVLLPIILTVCRCFTKYHLRSRGRHPPGPPASNKWPIWALGSPGPKYRASPWAPRAALPQAKGRPWPVRSAHRACSEPLEALSPPSPAPSYHLGTPRMRAVARTPANPPAPPDMSPPAAAEPPRYLHRSRGDFGDEDAPHRRRKCRATRSRRAYKSGEGGQVLFRYGVEL